LPPKSQYIYLKQMFCEYDLWFNIIWHKYF
jgi:hypothetical protein